MPNSENLLVIFTTFLIAFILMLLPMPDWVVMSRPVWVVLVLVYWSMSAPYCVNVGVAWIVGIILDVLNGTLLGEHALGLVVVTYIVVKMHSRLRMFPLVQQGISVFLLVLLYQGILFCVQGFIGELPRGWLYWSPALTSMLLWPWIFSIIRHYRHRFKAV